MAVLEHGNPYTHREERRESRAGGKCDWCGQARRVTYAYNFSRRTGGGPAWFCNATCWQAYNS